MNSHRSRKGSTFSGARGERCVPRTWVAIESTHCLWSGRCEVSQHWGPCSEGPGGQALLYRTRNWRHGRRYASWRVVEVVQERWVRCPRQGRCLVMVSPCQRLTTFSGRGSDKEYLGWAGWPRPWNRKPGFWRPGRKKRLTTCPSWRRGC